MVVPNLNDLDIADINDILQCVPEFDNSLPKYKRELTGTLTAFLSGVSEEKLNYFYLLSIKPAIKKWQQEKVPMKTITDLVTPDDLTENFDLVTQLLKEKKELSFEKIKLTEKIANKYAEAVASGLEQGKDEDARENQRHQLFPDLFIQLEENKNKLLGNQNAMAICKAELDYHRTVIDYFFIIKGER